MPGRPHSAKKHPLQVYLCRWLRFGFGRLANSRFAWIAAGDAEDLESQFGWLVGFHDAQKLFSLRRDAVLFKNEIYDRLRLLKKTVSEVASDATDYRAQLREAANDDAKAHAVQMISVQRLAKSAHKSLDDVYKALFK